MKGFYRVLSPFAPDQSGAVSVLYELGGVIVICDAGGCAGNICGFDEPRWATRKSAVFSAGVRDIDAILGRDDRMLHKIGDAVEQLSCRFIALIGTPVPAVIGTDLKALARVLEKRFGLPVLAVQTTGMGLYDKGQEAAYLELFRAFAGNEPGGAEIGVLGATPLDLNDPAAGARLAERVSSVGCGRAACYGLGAGLDAVRAAGSVKANLVVSPSGLKAAEWLKDKFGTPFVTGFPLSDRGAKNLAKKIEAAVAGRILPEPAPQTKTRPARTLIIHQQVLANAFREEFTAATGEEADVACWFMLEPSLSRPGDIHLKEEDSLQELLNTRGYETVAGDPMLRRAIPDWHGNYIELPHNAVTGGPTAGASPEECLERLLAIYNLWGLRNE